MSKQGTIHAEPGTISSFPERPEFKPGWPFPFEVLIIRVPTWVEELRGGSNAASPSGNLAGPDRILSGQYKFLGVQTKKSHAYGIADVYDLTMSHVPVYNAA